MGNNCECANGDQGDEIDLSQQFFNRMKDKNAFKTPLKVVEIDTTDYTSETLETVDSYRNYYSDLFGVKKQELPSFSYQMSCKDSPLVNGKGRLVTQKLQPTTDRCLNILQTLRTNNSVRKYELDIKFSRLAVLGPFELESKIIYFGQFNRGLREGFGCQIWPDESIYEGYWFGDKAHFYGRMIFNDGDYYEGEWGGDLMSGKGIFVSTKGFVYTGEFTDNEPNGLGEEKWVNSTRYKGQFKNGIKSGKGEILFPNGNSYNGDFSNNKPNGVGTFILVNGNSYHGKWIDSRMEGKGTCKFTGIASYSGEFKNNLKEGYGEIVFQSGKIIAGIWKNDKISGEFQIKFKGLTHKFLVDERGKASHMNLLTTDEAKFIENLQNHTDKENILNSN